MYFIHNTYVIYTLYIETWVPECHNRIPSSDFGVITWNLLFSIELKEAQLFPLFYFLVRTIWGTGQHGTEEQ